MIKLKTKAILKAAAWLIPLALLTNCSARVGVLSDDYGYDYYPYTYAYPYVKFGGPYYYDHHHHHHHGHKHKHK